MKKLLAMVLSVLMIALAFTGCAKAKDTAQGTVSDPVQGELGLVVIKVMLDFVQKRGFALFGWWRILVGGAGLAAIYVAGWGG